MFAANEIRSVSFLSELGSCSTMSLVWIPLIFLICLDDSYQENVEKPYYRAAVFEYHHLKDQKSIVDLANSNANFFIPVIAKAKSYGADIIVFPENGISSIIGNKHDVLEAATFVPPEQTDLCPTYPDNWNKTADFRKNANPTETFSDSRNSEQSCGNITNYQNYLQKVACAAKFHQIYVVINVQEKQNCAGSECPEDKCLLFNTIVTFDREGKVISRYRKFHLSDLYDLDSLNSRTKEPELATFQTDFNVTFGQFVCFDILFQSPAYDAIYKLGVYDFVFPTFWFSDLPFFEATQVQLGFSLTNDVNLLASNINRPTTGSSGSGIYAGEKGALVVNNAQKAGNFLLVANVPKFVEPGKRYEGVEIDPVVHEFSHEEIPTVRNNQAEMNFTFESLKLYTTQLYDPKTEKVFNKSICSKAMCCRFEGETIMEEVDGNKDHYRYRMAVFKGVVYFGNYHAGIEVCGIVACTNNSIESCGHVISNKSHTSVTFTKLKISRPVVDDDIYYTPSVYSTDMKILNVDSFHFLFYKKDKFYEKEIVMWLLKPRNDVFTFGIYGRVEKDDGKPVDQ